MDYLFAFMNSIDEIDLSRFKTNKVRKMNNGYDLLSIFLLKKDQTLKSFYLLTFFSSKNKKKPKR